MTRSGDNDETGASVVAARIGNQATRRRRPTVAHLLGIIGTRGGVSRPKPLLSETKTSAWGVVVNGFGQAPLSPIAVITALQSELRDRRATSLVALRTVLAAEVLPSAGSKGD